MKRDIYFNMTYVYDSYLSSELGLVGPYIALGASPPAGGGV